MSDLTGWSVEPKFDGWRCSVEARADRVVAWSRNGHDLSDSVPSLRALAGSGVILDGEIIAGDGSLASFYGLLGALGSRRPGAVHFVAFDVLAIQDEVLIQSTYADRRARLEALELPSVIVAPRYPGSDLDGLLDACAGNGMEGVVLKRVASVYRPGTRSADWRKIKCPSWSEHRERRFDDRSERGGRDRIAESDAADVRLIEERLHEPTMDWNDFLDLVGDAED